MGWEPVGQARAATASTHRNTLSGLSAPGQAAGIATPPASDKFMFPVNESRKYLFHAPSHRETEAHFTAAGMSSQRNQSDSFRFKRAAFYNGLKSKVGLAAAKAAALRVNLNMHCGAEVTESSTNKQHHLNVQGCGIVAPPMHASSRTPLLLPLLLSHNFPTPRVH